MLPLSGAVKIYYCRTPVNLHKSFDGLAGAVRQHLPGDPLSGHLFVFFNRSFNLVKILYWDCDGYAIWSKRLAQGRFNIPQSADGKFLDVFNAGYVKAEPELKLIRNLYQIEAEVNNGGSLVTDNLRNVNPNISCKSVTASRGKIVRGRLSG